MRQPRRQRHEFGKLTVVVCPDLTRTTRGGSAEPGALIRYRPGFSTNRYDRLGYRRVWLATIRPPRDASTVVGLVAAEGGPAQGAANPRTIPGRG